MARSVGLWGACRKQRNDDGDRGRATLTRARTRRDNRAQVATLQLQLVLTFVLLLAREGFRRACPRSVVSFAADAKQQQQQHRTQRQVNVMWLVVPVGSIVAAMVGSVFVATASELELAVPHYSLTIWLTVLAAVIELLAEPFYLLSQILQLFEARVRAEGLAVLVRCVVVFALVYSGVRRHTHRHASHAAVRIWHVCECSRSDSNAPLEQMGLLAFAYSQLVYAFVLLVMYMMAFERAIRSPSKEREPSLEGLTSIKQLFPSIAHQLGGSWFDDTSLKLWLSFAFQAIEKLILTEGEKVVLRFGDSLLHQAAYGVVHNLGTYRARCATHTYSLSRSLLNSAAVLLVCVWRDCTGSLVARFLFQPVEEICFTLFAGLVGGSHEQQAEQTNNAATCARVLQIVLKFMVLIGSIFVAFGTNYSWLLLELLYQGRYGTSTGAPTVLMCYCLFVLLIGINGTCLNPHARVRGSRAHAHPSRNLGGLRARSLIERRAQVLQLAVGGVLGRLHGCLVVLDPTVAHERPRARQLLQHGAAHHVQSRVYLEVLRQGHAARSGQGQERRPLVAAASHRAAVARTVRARLVVCAHVRVREESLYRAIALAASGGSCGSRCRVSRARGGYRLPQGSPAARRHSTAVPHAKDGRQEQLGARHGNVSIRRVINMYYERASEVQ